MVPKQRVLLISNLHRAASILRKHVSAFLLYESSSTEFVAYLRYQNLVSRRNTRCHPLALFVKTSGTDSEHFCFIELFYGALW